MTVCLLKHFLTALDMFVFPMTYVWKMLPKEYSGTATAI